MIPTICPQKIKYAPDQHRDPQSETERGALPTINAALKKAGIVKPRSADWQTVQGAFLRLDDSERVNFVARLDEGAP